MIFGVYIFETLPLKKSKEKRRNTKNKENTCFHWFMVFLGFLCFEPCVSRTFPRKLPGHVREISGNKSGKCPGNFREMSGKFPGIFREFSGTFPGHFREISGTFPGQIRELSREVSGKFYNVCTFWASCGRILVKIGGNSLRNFLLGPSKNHQQPPENLNKLQTTSQNINK